MQTFSTIKMTFTALTSLTSLIILTATMFKLSYPRFWKILSQNCNSMHINCGQKLIIFHTKKILQSLLRAANVKLQTIELRG